MAAPARRRRRYRRRTVRVQVEYTSETGPCRAVATTLGAGGLFVATESPLPRDTALTLRFRLLRGGRLNHAIEGRVVWSRKPGDAGSHAPGMGIQFTDRAAAQQLARELEHLD